MCKVWWLGLDLIIHIIHDKQISKIRNLTQHQISACWPSFHTPNSQSANMDFCNFYNSSCLNCIRQRNCYFLELEDSSSLCTVNKSIVPDEIVMKSIGKFGGFLCAKGNEKLVAVTEKLINTTEESSLSMGDFGKLISFSFCIASYTFAEKSVFFYYRRYSLAFHICLAYSLLLGLRA